MGIHEKLTNAFLEELHNGNSPFQVIPQKIGSIIYCDTSNYQKEAYTTEEKKKMLFKRFIICLSIPLLSFILFQDYPIWNTIVTIVAVIAFIWYIHKINTFNGVDYFVGKDGFSILKFEGKRTNITEEATFLFEEISQLITGETYKKVNYSYSGTDYFFTFFSHPDSELCTKMLHEYGGSYYQEKPRDEIFEGDYLFYKKIEEQWCFYTLEKMNNQLISPTFSILISENNQWKSIPYITFNDDCITIGDRVYDKNTIKKIDFQNGTLIVEHINHSKKWFGLKEEGNIEHIPLSNLGNKKLFLLYLSSYYN